MTAVKTPKASHVIGVEIDLWVWSGKYFGYREGDDLWTYSGRHVGRFEGDEVYGTDGQYLGELWDGDRLITNITKRLLPCGSAFAPCAPRSGHARCADRAGYTTYAGYQDFPGPDKFD